MSLILKEYINVLNENGLIVSVNDHSCDKKEVLNLTYNSKEVKENTLFVCKGAAFKAEYLQASIKDGAFAYVSEIDYNVDIPAIIVNDVRLAMAFLAKMFYEIPQGALDIIAVTGTKGKTTTCYYLRKIFDHYYKKSGKKEAAFLTSIDTYDGSETEPSANTTPEIFEGYRHLRNAYDNGIKTVIMEVSSQGLKYDRVTGMEFDTGVILNISPDHISPVEHPDFEDYFMSKLKLYSMCKNVVVNLDAEFSDDMIRSTWMNEGVYTYGEYGDGDYKIKNVMEFGNSVTFDLWGEGKFETFDLGMRGAFNVENAAAAIIIGRLHGIPFEDMKEALKEISIPGRGEEYETEDGSICAIVDYAHNEVSCRKIIEAAKREWPDRKIISIFGCPGGKGVNRREGMGTSIPRLSDMSIITMDDPANEELMDICKEIASYAGDNSYEIIEDRVEAIKRAFEMADEPSVIMVLGKGCETAQKIGKKSVPYVGDAAVVKECIALKNNK